MESLHILYEDQWLLAINKLSGLSVERNPFEQNTIEDLAWQHVIRERKNPFLGIVHRLDRGTSGVLLLAKRKQALKELNAQFEAQQVEKTYLALTETPPPQPEGMLEHWLVKDTIEKRAVLYPKKRERAAFVKLHYQVKPHDGPYTLLEIKPETGKYHQIRAQLSAIGCPIVGDEKYGSTVNANWGNWALHAWKINFKNPLTGEAQLLTSDTISNPNFPANL